MRKCCARALLVQEAVVGEAVVTKALRGEELCCAESASLPKERPARGGSTNPNAELQRACKHHALPRSSQGN